MLVYISGLISIAVFSVTGVIAAEKKNMDIVSVVALGLITALGGGTLRDVMLNQKPVFWIVDTNYFWMSFAASVFFFFFSLKNLASKYEILLIADAIGVSMFNIQAIEMTIRMNYSGEIAILMGIVTGIAGSVVRDLLTQEKVLFLKNELYATPLLIGGSVYFLLKETPVSGNVVFWGGVISAFLIRVAAIKYNLCYPAYFIYRSSQK